MILDNMLSEQTIMTPIDYTPSYDKKEIRINKQGNNKD